MVAAASNADVTLIERNAIGGSAVLTDVVPSKTLIATADMMTRFSEALKTRRVRRRSFVLIWTA